MLLKGRKDIGREMFEVLRQNVAGLSAELQGILVDDLVTAFRNKINLLIGDQTRRDR
jgi:hypothetical protein